MEYLTFTELLLIYEEFQALLQKFCVSYMIKAGILDSRFLVDPGQVIINYYSSSQNECPNGL